MDEKRLLRLLENNAKLTSVDLAMALQESEETIDSTLRELETKNIICGYHTLINWDPMNENFVQAYIQVQSKPERDFGYDRIAQKIAGFPEVDSLYLLSGASEFCVIVKGKTMQEIAHFVGSKLAPMEAISGTSTLFVLKQYKKNGVIFDGQDTHIDKRLVVTP